MKAQNKKIAVLFLSIACCIQSSTTFAGNKLFKDSLLNIIKMGKQDTNSVNAFASLSSGFAYSNPDTAFYFGQQGISLAKKINFKRGLAINLLSAANSLYIKGIFNDAKEYYLKSLEIYLELRDKTGISRCYNNIGNIFDDMGNYTQAVEYYMKSLKIKEEQGEKKGIAQCYNNLGLVQFNQLNYDKALDYFEKSLKIKEEIKDEASVSRCYNNIGLIFTYKKQYVKALEYYQKSLKFAEQTGDKNGIAQANCNIGINYYYQIENMERTPDNADNIDKTLTLALEYYRKSLKISEELGEKMGIASVLGNIASVFNQRKNYAEGLQNAEKSLQLAREIGFLELERNAQQYISDSYKGMQKYKEAMQHFEQFKLLNDSIFNTEKQKQLTQMEAIYQSEKKQKEIELLNKDKEKQAAISEAENKKHKAIIYAVVSILILVLAFAIFAYRSYLQKRKANVLLAQQKLEIVEKNEELNQQNEEIASQRDSLGLLNAEVTAQRDEISAQRDMVTSQKNHIEEIYGELTDSIQYAKKIQTAVLPSEEYITNKLLSLTNVGGTSGGQMNYFIVFKPKDIVSGDFYFVENKNNKLYFAVADCTGHGVPGAFMSMLGISFFNEIIAKQETYSAGQILDELRNYIIHSLQQKGSMMEQKDGMDISFCMINTDTLEMQFAGANNPCWIVNSPKSIVDSQQSTECSQQPSVTLSEVEGLPQLLELKPDKQPIGIYSNMQPFTNQNYQLQKGDIIYLMSDGFEDQFGGPNRKKFLAKNLKNLLIANSQYPIADQKQILDTTITAWIGTGEQIDDISVLGLKI